MMRLLIAYALVCGAMIFVSCFAKERQAIGVAVLLSVSHVVGAMAWIYLPAAPATVMHHIGYPDFTHTQTRAIVDGLLASWVAYSCGRYWWGAAIWTALIATGAAHILHENYGMAQIAYAYSINGLFLVMAATLLLIGGRGALQYVGDTVRRLAARGRDLLRPRRAARRQARGQ